MEISPKRFKLLVLISIIASLICGYAQDQNTEIKTFIAQLQMEKELAQKAGDELSKLIGQDSRVFFSCLQYLKDADAKGKKSILLFFSGLDEKNSLPLHGEYYQVWEMDKRVSAVDYCISAMQDSDWQSLTVLHRICAAISQEDWLIPAQSSEQDRAKVIQTWQQWRDKELLKRDLAKQIEEWAASSEPITSQIAALLHEEKPIWARLQAVQILGQYISKKDEIATVMIEALTKETNALMIRQLAATLSQQGVERAATNLVSLLTHQDAGVRQDIVCALALLQSPEIPDVLIDQFAKEQSPEVKLTLVQALGRGKNFRSSEKIVSTLLAVLTKEKESKIICEALSMLANWQVREALDPMLALFHHESQQVRQASVTALTIMKDTQKETQVPAKLVEIFPKEHTVEMQTAILVCLASYRDYKAIFAVLKGLPASIPQDKPAFLAALSNCADIIEERFGYRVIGDMDARLDHDMIQALSMLQDAKSNEQLAQNFTKQSEDVSASLLKILIARKEYKNIEAILEALPNNFYESNTRLLMSIADSAKLLMSIADSANVVESEVGLEVLSILAKEPADLKVRKYALDYLLPLVTAAKANLLIDILSDENLDIRKSALARLEELVAPLFPDGKNGIRLLGYEAEGELLEQYSAIIRWKHWWDFRQLLPMLSEKNEEQRNKARNFIKEQEDWVVPSLLQYYLQASPEVRLTILELLATWNHPQAIAHLKTTLEDKDSNIANQSFASLLEIYKRHKLQDIQDVLRTVFSKAEDKMNCALNLVLVDEAGFSESTKYLQEQLEVADRREEIFKALEKRQVLPSVFVSYLNKSLEGTDAKLKERVFEMLVKIPSRPAWDMLILHFSILNPVHRGDLINQLGKSYREGIEKLLPQEADKEKRGLGDADEEAVKMAFCNAVKDNKIQKAASTLISWLNIRASLELQKLIVDTLTDCRALKTSHLTDIFSQEKDRVENKKFLLQTLARLEDVPESFWENLLTEELSQALQIQVIQIVCQVSKLEKFIPRAMDQISRQANAEVRKMCLQEIQKLSSLKEGLSPLIQKIFIAEKENDVKILAIQLMGKAPQKEAQPILMEWIKNEKDTTLRQEALKQLVSLGKADCVEELLPLMSKEQDGVWKTALRNTIVELSPEKGIPLLQTAISASSPDMEAFSLLKTKAPDQARKELPVIFNKLQEDQQKVTFFQTNQNLFDREHLPWLLQMLPISNAQIGKEIAQIASKITGIPEYPADASADEQKKTVALWQNWNEEWQTIASLVKELLQSKDIKVRAELCSKISQYSQRGIDLLQQELRLCSNPEQQQILVEALAESKSPQAIPTFTQMLNHPSPQVRRAVYLGLDKLGHKLPLPVLYWQETSPLGRVTLIDLMLRHNITLYQNAWEEYLSSKEESVWAALIDMMARYPIADKKRALLDNLLKIPTENLMERAREILKDEMTLEDLDTLAQLVNKQKEENAARAFLLLLRNFPEIPEQARADRAAFVTWWDKNRTGLEKQIILIRTLNNFLTEEAEFGDYFQKMTKLEADDRTWAQNKLISIFKTRESPKQKQRIVKLLGTYGNSQNAPFFVENMAHVDGQNIELARNAAWGLYRIGYTAIPDIIEKNTQHVDPTIRFFAIKALGESGKKPLQETLSDKVFSDTDICVREEALYWAIELGFDNREKLLKLTQDQAYNVRALAINRLAELGEKQIIGTLIEYLKLDPWPDMQQLAYRSLIKLSAQNIDYMPQLHGKQWLTMKERREWQDWWKSEKRQQALEQWQNWWKGYQRTTEIQNWASKFADEGINPELVRNKILAEYDQIPINVKQDAAKTMEGLLAHPNARIRLGMAQLYGSRKEIPWQVALAKKLLDDDVQVRYTALVYLKKSVQEKLPFASPWAFDAGDFKNPGVLVQKLASSKDPLTTYLMGQFSAENQKLCSDYKKDDPVSDKLKLALVEEFNRLLEVELYDKERFAQVNLSSYTQAFLKKSADYPVYINRLLLEDFYPEELRQWRKEVEQIVEWWQQGKPRGTEELRKNIDEWLGKIDKEPTLVSKILEQGPRAHDIVKSHLISARPEVVCAAVSILCQWKDYDCVETMISMLKHAQLRVSVRASLQKLFAESIPLAPTGEDEKAYEHKLKTWWAENVNAQQDKWRSVVEKSVTEITTQNLDADSVQKVVERLGEMGNRSRPIVQEYFAEAQENAVLKRTLIAVFTKYNDPRAIPVLAHDLGNSKSEVRETVLNSIHGLAGDSLQKLQVTPKTEEEWKNEQQRILDWWNTSQSNLQKQRETALLNPDPKLREQAIAALASHGVRVSDLISRFCQDATTQEAALKSLKEIGFARLIPTEVVGAILPLITQGQNSEIKKLAGEAVAQVTGLELPTPDDVQTLWNNEVEQLLKWWQEHKKSPIYSISQDKMSLLLVDLAENKIKSEDVQKQLTDMGVGVASVLRRYWQDQNDLVKIGSIRACTILGFSSIGQPQEIAQTLLDSNIGVRREMLTTLQSLREDKIPVTFDEEREKHWQKQVNDWLKVWQEQQQKAREELELKNLEADAAVLLKTQQLNAQEHIEAARKTASYLQNPFTSVSKRALEILKKFGQQEISFNPDATLEERQNALKNIESWISDKGKEIEKNTQDLQNQLKELQERWKQLDSTRDLITAEQCDMLLNMTAEMPRQENAYPLIQKKYLAILKQNGCEVLGYDVYADIPERVAVLEKIRSAIYDRRKELRSITEKGEKVLVMVRPMFELQEIRDPQSLASAQKVVEFLEHPYQPLRQKAIDCLLKISGDKNNRGYNSYFVVSKNQEAIKLWKNWIEQQGDKLIQNRKDYIQKVETACTQLASVQYLEDDAKLEQATLLYSALTDAEEPIRRKALEVLTVLNGKQDFGYQSQLTSDRQAENLAKWTQWLEAQKQQLQYYREIKAAIQRIESGKQVQTIAQAADITRLIEGLDATWPVTREICLKSLTVYAEKYTSVRVTENTKVAWKKWSDDTLQPVVEREKQTLEQIDKWDIALAEHKITSLSNWTLAKNLIRYLQAEQESVRNAAIAVLKKLNSGNTYDFDSSEDSAQREKAIKLWQLWLERQKRSLIRQAAERITNGAKIQTALQVEDAKALIEGLDSVLFIRETAFRALSEYAKKYAQNEVPENFGYDPKATDEIRNKAKRDWDKWFEEKIKPLTKQDEK